MKNKLFGQDGTLAVFVDRFMDCFGLSCMWLLLSCLIVTIPVASIALYDAISRCVVGDEPSPFKRFWRTVWRELGRGLLMGLEWMVVAAVAVFFLNYIMALGQINEIFKLYSIVYLVTMLVPLSVALWMVPVESRFVYKFWELHKVAASFCIANLPRTALLVGMLLAFVALILFLPNTLILILLIPGFMTLLQTAIIEPVFRPYMPSEEADELD
jgi:uncharacterized membrane protein YesL